MDSVVWEQFARLFNRHGEEVETEEEQGSLEERIADQRRSLKQQARAAIWLNERFPELIEMLRYRSVREAEREAELASERDQYYKLQDRVSELANGDRQVRQTKQ